MKYHQYYAYYISQKMEKKKIFGRKVWIKNFHVSNIFTFRNISMFLMFLDVWNVFDTFPKLRLLHMMCIITVQLICSWGSKSYCFCLRKKCMTRTIIVHIFWREEQMMFDGRKMTENVQLELVFYHLSLSLYSFSSWTLDWKQERFLCQTRRRRWWW